MTGRFKIKAGTFIRGNAFTDKELCRYSDLAIEQGIYVLENFAEGSWCDNLAWYCGTGGIWWHEVEDCEVDGDLDVTEAYRNYLDNDKGNVDEKKPFTRDDLNDGMVLMLKDSPHLYFIMFSGVYKTLSANAVNLVCDFDSIDEDMNVHDLEEDPIPIVRVEYAGKVLFDRTLEEELNSLEKQKKEIEDKIKQLKGE